MSTGMRLPKHSLRLTSYEQLAEFCRAFANGHLNFLLLLGRAGLGKSRCLHEAVGAEACWIDANATPFGIYMQAFEHRNRPIVLDDVDGLFRNRAGIRLLKALCQSDPVKHLSWESDAPALERRCIPRQFTTRSRLALVANEWRSSNADLAALEDRGHVLVFDPDPLAVHRQAAGWYRDQEIFDFVADHLHLMREHSLRTYVLASELKQAGLDWRGMVLTRCLTGAALKVARLRADPRYASEEERVRSFVDAGHGCRATYFNYAKKLRASGETPRIALGRSAPSTGSSCGDWDELSRST